MNGEEIATVKDTDGETVIVNTIKENIDKLSKKIVTLQKGDNDNFYVTKVVNRDVDFWQRKGKNGTIKLPKRTRKMWNMSS